MATYQALTAISQAIVNLLRDAAAAYDEFKLVKFEPIQTVNFKKPAEDTDTVTLFLYQVTPSAVRRHLAPRTLPDGRHTRPPLLVDLHYALTPWCSDYIQQQYLLGWCLRVLGDTPVLLPGLLNLAGRAPAEHPTHNEQIFGPTETVELVLDVLSLQDMVNITEALKPGLPFGPLSVSYLARMVAIESDVPLVEPELIQTREFKYEKTIQP